MNTVSTASVHDRRPVSIRPVSSAGWSLMEGDRRATHRTAYANYLYITREVGRDTHGLVDYRHRDDLVASGLELPADHPRWAEAAGLIWREADAAFEQAPPSAIRAWHLVLSLPATHDKEGWTNMVRGFVRETLVARGPAVAWAIHASPSDAGDWRIRPHAHLLMTTSAWRHGVCHGRTVPAWCGQAVRAAIHTNWLARLPEAMRRSAIEPYRRGDYKPARMDCSALRARFESHA